MRKIDRSRYKLGHIVGIVAVMTVLLQVTLMYKHQCCFWKQDSTAGEKRVRLVPYERLRASEITPEPTLNTHCAEKDYMHVPKRKPPYKRRLTIGIPTVKRRDGEYFMDMLSSMFNKTSESDLKEIVFVIFLADINNTEWKTETEARLKSKYSEHIQSGALEVIKAPPKFYTDMPIFVNNSYMQWRTKQNYDYAYIMKYCEYLSEYYMQMEDDVIASDGYFNDITTFIGNQSDEWVCLEFSELGFIGKVYHSKHIDNLANMLLMFSETQPVDYTFLYFNVLMHNGQRRIRKPTLFQHQGYHSSLSEKVQPLRDKFFDFPAKEWKGDNPSAHIYTSLKTSDSFPPNLAYSLENGHFWSAGAAHKGDVYVIAFDTPQNIDSIVIESGSKEHPSDIIRAAVIEACVSVEGTHDVPECANEVHLKDFENGKVFVNSTDIAPKLGVIKAKGLQIRFTQNQMEWVVIKEIAVFITK